MRRSRTKASSPGATKKMVYHRVAAGEKQPGRMLLVMSEAARKAFACPPAIGVVDDVDLALVDPNDED